MELDIKGLLRVLWRRLLLIVLVATQCVGVAIGLSLLQTPVYEASIKVLVGQDRSRASGNLAGDVQGLQNFTQTASELISTRPVAEAVIQELDLSTSPDSLLGNMNVQPAKETQVLQVSYKDTDPIEAQNTANAIGEVFSEQVSEVSPSANAITATVWEQATVPDEPISPDPIRNGLLALVLGTILGVGLAFLLEFIDDSWRSPEEAEQISGVPTFGLVREFKVPRRKKGKYKESKREQGKERDGASSSGE